MIPQWAGCTADRYDVQLDEEAADEAMRMLGGMPTPSSKKGERR